MFDQCNVASLAEEYHYLASLSVENIEKSLIVDHEWSKEAASEVLRLARSKGSFLLRNALALAIALDVEDGDQGF